MGLFATKNFKTDEKVAPYLGEELTADQRKQRYGSKWGPYIYFKPWGHPSIDAQFYRGAAAFANDGTWIPDEDGVDPKKRHPDRSNIYLRRGWLHAKKPIRKGAELLLDYGERYWKRRFEGMPSVDVSGGPPTLVLKEQLGGGSGGGWDCPPAQRSDIEATIDDFTPVEKHGAYWLKRDDLFEECGVRGGKVRTCLTYILDHMDHKNIGGLVTGGSRSSPQVQIVGHIAKCLGIPARLHLPKGKLPPYIQEATADNGHKVFQWFPGFNHVLSARARDDAANLGESWLEIPFGMEVPQAVSGTAEQVENLPFDDPDFKRIVVPVGSGMTLAGVLTGLQNIGIDVPVLGVVVGQDPSKRLDKWAPTDWRDRVRLVRSPLDYHKPAPLTDHSLIEHVALDPIYEAKTVPFLKEGDLLWIVGHR